MHRQVSNKYHSWFRTACMLCIGLLCTASAGATDWIENGNNSRNDTMKTNRIIIEFNGHSLNATLENNSSAMALIELLEKGPVIISMNDYASMEKVGDLPVSLPQNNHRIQTNPGDLILYLGRHFVIYYDHNEYSLTKLGKIDGICSGKTLKNMLGRGNIKITLRLATED